MEEQRFMILSSEDIRQKIRRITYQIIEDNYNESRLVLIGIRPNGHKLAELLAAEIHEISELWVDLYELELNKENPLQEEIQSEIDKEAVENNVIILVDDVANTGKTLFYALKPLLNFSPKKVQVAVLIDREHKSFPVSSDYVGLVLSTTMKEHIMVEIEDDKIEAFLEDKKKGFRKV